MNDLLNEDEFLPKEHYNPWRWFALFIILCMLINLGAYWYVKSLMHTYTPNGIDYTLIIIAGSVFIISPIALSVIMCYANRNRFKTKTGTLALAIFLVVFTGLLVNTASSLAMTISQGATITLMVYTQPFLGYIVIYLVSIALTVPFIRRKQKRMNITAR